MKILVQSDPRRTYACPEKCDRCACLDGFIVFAWGKQEHHRVLSSGREGRGHEMKGRLTRAVPIAGRCSIDIKDQPIVDQTAKDGRVSILINLVSDIGTNLSTEDGVDGLDRSHIDRHVHVGHRRIWTDRYL